MSLTTEYIFILIGTLINNLSLIVMIPCFVIVLRSQTMHTNCKVLVITSSIIQLLLLFSQNAIFLYNYITNRLLRDGGISRLDITLSKAISMNCMQIIRTPMVLSENQKPFQMAQNGLFIISSCLYLGIVLERFDGMIFEKNNYEICRIYAVWNAAEYEGRKGHPVPLFIIFIASLTMAILKGCSIYFDAYSILTIYFLYGVEGITLILSILIIIYARYKSRTIPYGKDRLKAKYQIKEVIDFSTAVLPSIILSVVMNTISLVPVLLRALDACEITYSLSCLIYYSAHSLNCILSKLTLVSCHKRMRQRFKLPFVSKASAPKASVIRKDDARVSNEYFEQLNTSWNGVQKNLPAERRKHA